MALGWRSDLPPEMVEAVELGLELLRRLGVDVDVTEGYRTIERQNQLFAQGRTRPGQKVTNARGGQSAHNYGLAVDLRARRGYNSEDQKVVHEVGKFLGFGTVTNDLPHWEWPGWSRFI